MTRSRTLHPEDEIAQYRVVGPLGAGGMGEVYLAQDRTLERNIALKVLPPELVRSEERVRRFQQEAKSASSLNHPNIVTIYEIGQETVRSNTGSDAGSGPLHYIAMELISGKTLGAKIHEEKTDLKTLLGYLAQAAEGIAKAHAAGIVHRDLKPGNIMVSDDGFAKVLDFGLAKLTEKRFTDASATAMTEVGAHTTEGTVLGTVGYMSPEQVQAKSVDHRSDIFSFGCLLYEAATGRRPFVAESNVETMHKIIHDRPQPIEEITPSVPAELRRLIRRCLAKSPDQRLQSMKDVAIELREIADEYDTLSASATSGSGSGSAVAMAPARKVRVTPIVAAAVLIAAAGIVYGLWSSKRGGEPAEEPFQNMRIVTQTNRGDVGFCAISPDARFLAYIGRKGNESTIRVKQIATGSDVEVLPMQDATFESPCFSPDGNYLFFLKRKVDAPSYRSLMSVPSLGGPEQERAFDVDSRVTFSPDARRACFMRGVPQKNYSALFVIDLDTGKERELAAVRIPDQIAGAPSWSPDGKRISAPLLSQAPELRTTIALFDAESGEREDFWTRKAVVATDAVWLPDGKGFVLAGTDVTLGIRQQVFVLTYPDARYRRVTNDLNTYTQPTVAAGEEAIAAVRANALTNIFVAPLGGGEVRALTSATNPEYSPFSFSAGPGRVFYAAIRGEYTTMFSLSLDGGEAVPMSTGSGHVLNGWATQKEVIFNRYDTIEQRQHGWRVNQDGTGLRAVTTGTGERLLDVSNDGRWATFSRTDSTRGVWVVSLESGEARQVSATGLNGAAPISPDGRSVAVLEFEEDEHGLIRNVFKVIPIAGGDVVANARPPQQAVGHTWGPDGQSITFIDRADPASNVYRMGMADATPRPVTKFTDGRVTSCKWSRDGTRLAVMRRIGEAVNVWVVMADGSQPKQITNFTTESVFQIDWTPDDKSVVVSAGRQSSDAVLIKDFR